MLLFAFHVVALGAFDAYTRIASLDLLMHFLGGVVMAFFLHQASINASQLGILGPHHPITNRVLVFTATCTVALLWEFAEFVLDQTLGTHSQAGIDDTMADLLLGTFGAGAFTLYTVRFDRYPNRSPIGIVQPWQNSKDTVPGD